jgi:RimJ/RimL family protein N-acetyltransferase
MTYENQVIRGTYCILRPVREDDAEFIVSLRNDAKLARHISKSVESVEQQQQWIRSYFGRNKEGLEYYFIACDLDEVPCGTFRLYNVTECECTGGSWVMRRGAPLPVSLESYLLPMRFSFTILAKKVMRIDVRKENLRVWKWHEMCGAKFIREDDFDRYYEYSPEGYPVAERAVYKIISP